MIACHTAIYFKLYFNMLYKNVEIIMMLYPWGIFNLPKSSSHEVNLHIPYYVYFKSIKVFWKTFLALKIFRHYTVKKHRCNTQLYGIYKNDIFDEFFNLVGEALWNFFFIVLWWRKKLSSVIAQNIIVIVKFLNQLLIYKVWIIFFSRKRTSELYLEKFFRKF